MKQPNLGEPFAIIGEHCKFGVIEVVYNTQVTVRYRDGSKALWSKHRLTWNPEQVRWEVYE